MPSEKKQRTVYLDLLRVLAMVGVVGIHVSARHFADVPLDSAAWRAMNLWDGLVRWSVPVFAMVSGAVFLDPGKRITGRAIFKKYLPRIVLAFIFWSALYAAIDCGGSLRAFVTRFLCGHYHLWFLYMLAGLYLLVPVLRRITREPRLTWYFLALSAVFTFGVPDLLLLAQKLDGVGNLGLAPIVTEIQQYVMFFFTLGFVLAPVLNARYSAALGSAQVEFFAYSKFCVLFQTAGVFAAAKAAAERLGETARQLVIRFAACSFGVYLVHPLLLDNLVPAGLLTCGAWTYLTIPLTIFVTAALSLVVSVLLRLIPWLGRRIV